MTGHKKILVIDDEGDLLAELAIGLSAALFCVVTASNGQEGLEMAKKERPDLILLDIVMPKLSGYEICLELKKNPVLKKIPVILITAMAQESDKRKGMEAGANGWLVKPYPMALLLEKIRGFLGEAP